MSNLNQDSDLSVLGDFSAQDAKRDRIKHGSKIFDFEYGDNLVRFLPPLKTWEQVNPFFCTHTHFVPVVGKDKKVPISCLQIALGAKCPVCEMQSKFATNANNNEHDAKMAFSLKANPNFMANALVQGLVDAGPMLVRISKDLHGKLMDLRNSKPKGGGYMFHPTKGKWTVITKAKKKNGYDEFSCSMDQDEAWPLAKTDAEILALCLKQTDIAKSEYGRIDTYADAVKKMSGESNTQASVGGRNLEARGERIGGMLNQKIETDFASNSDDNIPF